LLGTAYNYLDTTSNGIGDDSHGAGDLNVGMKYAPHNWTGQATQATLVGYLTLPAGAAQFSDGRPGYQIYAQLRHALGDQTGDGVMLGFLHQPAATTEYVNSWLIAAEYDFPVATEVSGYMEAEYIYGINHLPQQTLVGAGLAWLPVSTMQLDAYFDHGLSDSSPDWLIGIGFSILF
jgi:Putative MetA-pathway of phenol degradation